MKKKFLGMIVLSMIMVLVVSAAALAGDGSGGGGGARLTELGEFVLTRYRQMEADAERAIEAGVADLRQHLATR